ncbi:MAG: hypothetical protein M3303_01640 [Gemmatimonadota bacterium]|nr:hypothetical protein [Gemmatimonadota bacterium]
MSLTTSYDASWTCQHERRPHTTVCLLCRRDERAAVLARRRRAAGRVSLIGLAVVFFSAGGVAAVTAMEGRWPAAPVLERWPGSDGWLELARTRTRDVISNLTRRASAAPVPIYASPVVADSVALTDSLQIATATDSVLAALDEALRRAHDSAAAAPPLKPIVAEGRTALRDGLVAVRTGDTITVHFDTPLLRTRQPQKFEQLVRATLPSIYGAAVEAVLATVAAGDLIRGVDPTRTASTHGVYLPLAAGWNLALWPETRPGRDGPLIVTYRTALTR